MTRCALYTSFVLFTDVLTRELLSIPSCLLGAGEEPCATANVRHSEWVFFAELSKHRRCQVAWLWTLTRTHRIVHRSFHASLLLRSMWKGVLKAQLSVKSFPWRSALKVIEFLKHWTPQIVFAQQNWHKYGDGLHYLTVVFCVWPFDWCNLRVAFALLAGSPFAACGVLQRSWTILCAFQNGQACWSQRSSGVQLAKSLLDCKN